MSNALSEPGLSAGEAGVSKPITTRYFALDAVRAVAMLLGVVYHAILFGGGMMGTFGGGKEDFTTGLMSWIHSFRMPLFFLISGFFSHLILVRYGVKAYLLKRWWRIGMPFLIALFVLAGIRGMRSQQGFSGNGPMPVRDMRAGNVQTAPPEGTGPQMRPGGPPPGSMLMGEGEMPKPPPGFMPPFLAQFDTDKNGEFSDAEWKEAQLKLKEQFRDNSRVAGPNGREPVPGGLPQPMTQVPLGPPQGPAGFPGGMPRDGTPPMNPPGGGPEFIGIGFPGAEGHPIAERIFGSSASNFSLQHLWFLWYLMLFATVAPFAARLIKRIFKSVGRDRLKGLDKKIWWGVWPLLVALIVVPGMYISGTAPGQPPSGMMTIFGIFPDVLFRFDKDWVYFFTYFMVGWWLFTQASQLEALARWWLPVFCVGLVAYFISEKAFSPVAPFGASNVGTAEKIFRHWLFAMAVCCISAGFIGFFQKFLNRPTRITRYLADTAFWIYLVHQDLLNFVVLDWIRPWGLPSFAQMLVATTITVGIALISFEILVRKTPLTNLFGPPKSKKVKIPNPVIAPA
ncbi:MAG: acyltransferase family protein [Verrucomicrobiota bacterium]|nr:acyltransferase family protein [Verrucomicrobiota bacterium]